MDLSLSQKQLKELYSYMKEISPDGVFSAIELILKKTNVVIHKDQISDNPESKWCCTVLGNSDFVIAWFRSRAKAVNFCRRYELPYEVEPDYQIK